MCISNMPSICTTSSVLLGDQGWVIMVMVMTDVSQCSLCARYVTCVTHISLSCDLAFPNSPFQEDQKDSERNAAGNKKAGI